LVFPFCFVLYESLFDLKRPWGVVALSSFAFAFSEISMDGILPLLTRTPIAIIAMSYVIGGLVSMIPVKGTKGLNMRGVPASEA
jgi:hypothetical protein